jgi:hypothetical protein
MTAVTAMTKGEREDLRRPRHSHIFARDSAGHYVEPLWCSARLFEAESFGAPGAQILDPACGWGRIMQAARDAGLRARPTLQIGMGILRL